MFTQKFTAFDRVSLKTGTIGLQLPDKADVKVRGVLVGQVMKVESKGDGAANSSSASSPDKIKTIPSNVTAAILPKTLFGEKYVELNIPSDPSSKSLQAGDKIEPDEDADRGRAGAQRPLPAAAHGAARGARTTPSTPSPTRSRDAATRSARAW